MTEKTKCEGGVREAFKKAVGVLPEETRKTIATLEYSVSYRNNQSRRADMAKSEDDYILACPLGVPMVLGGKSSGGFAPGSGDRAIEQWVRVGQITDDQAASIGQTELDALGWFIHEWDEGLIPQEDLADLFSVTP